MHDLEGWSSWRAFKSTLRASVAQHPACASIRNMAESELNVDSIISRLLEGSVPWWYFISLRHLSRKRLNRSFVFSTSQLDAMFQIILTARILRYLWCSSTARKLAAALKALGERCHDVKARSSYLPSKCWIVVNVCQVSVFKKGGKRNNSACCRHVGS